MNIKSLPFHSRLAISLFCVTLLMGVVYAILSINVALTGKPNGFASLEQIHDKYAGIEIIAAMKGSMYENVSEDKSITAVKNWVDSGAGEDEYSDKIASIMEEDCTDCHNVDSTMSDAKPDMPLTTYEEVLAHTERGKPLGKLAIETHIHLFGIGMLLLLSGFMFSITSIVSWAKTLFICAGFLGAWGDTLSLTFAKYIDFLGYTTPFTGATMIVSLCVMLIIVLLDCWIRVPIIGTDQ